MPIDLTILKTDMTSGPLASAAASLITHADDVGLAAMWNAVGSDNVTEQTITRDVFLLAIIPAIGALGSGQIAAGVVARWDRYLSVIRAADNITTGSPTIQGLLAAAVADGLLTSGQAAAIGVRHGSRAEVLFGAGTILTAADMGAAR